VEATARKAFGENDFDESGLTNMELSSVRLKVRDLTPRIGSEIVTDVETLLSGRESAHIREVLEQRGVVYFRGLEISDAQQVAIAKTLGTIVANEGEEGIYKISLDDKVNQRAKYLKGSLFWHFDGSLQKFTPESVMRIERNLGADVIMQFDHVVPGQSDEPSAREAMERSVRWLERCRAEFARLTREDPDAPTPDQALFPIVQGGIHASLRRESTRAICAMDAAQLHA